MSKRILVVNIMMKNKKIFLLIIDFKDETGVVCFVDGVCSETRCSVDPEDK